MHMVSSQFPDIVSLYYTSKEQPKHRAAVFSGRVIDAPAVAQHDVANQGEAYAGTLGSSRKVRHNSGPKKSEFER